MVQFVEADRSALRSDTSPWLPFAAQHDTGRRQVPSKVDAVIVGAGITGALTAEALTAANLSVLIVDPSEPAMASTAASTAMLQWEIDAPLMELADRYGFAKAASIYQRSYSAVQNLIARVRSLRIECNLFERPSLYLARGDVSAAELRAEWKLRQRVGLPGEFLSSSELDKVFGLRRDAAIASYGSCEADPVKLARGLLDVSLARGAQLIKGRVVDISASASECAVLLEDGRTYAASKIILATGYALPALLRSDIHAFASSWAIATVPQTAGSLWREKALIWDASEQYNYVRTTFDNRIIIGGEDENYSDPARREQAMAEKSRILGERLKELWPEANPTIDYQWAGVFGETRDGLPIIGTVPDQHGRVLAAYGYGGNGITFSFMAASLIRDQICGRHENAFGIFSPDRTVH